MIGASGSGKTTYAYNLFHNDIYLSSDRFRAVVGTGEDDQSVSKQVFDLMEVNLRYFLSLDRSVIIDATNRTKQSRERFVKVARQYNSLIHAYFFDISIPELKRRNSLRKRRVPDNVILKQYAGLEVPNSTEVDHLYIVDERGVTNQEF